MRKYLYILWLVRKCFVYITAGQPQRATNGWWSEWRVENGEWKVENGELKVHTGQLK